MDKNSTFWQITKDLPSFTKSYTNALHKEKKISTAIVQATELRAFLSFLANYNHVMDARKMDISLLEKMDRELLDHYFLQVSPNTRIIKFSYLNMFFLHLVKSRSLSYNPLWDYEVPAYVAAQKHYVQKSDVIKTLAGISSGLSLSEREARYAPQTQLRDMAIISLLYFCNLSLSQCAALNKDRVLLGEDTGVFLSQAWALLEENNIGDPTMLLYSWLLSSEKKKSELYEHFHSTGSLFLDGKKIPMGETAVAILTAYLLDLERGPMEPLFCSLRRRRISERTIEQVVSKHFKRYADTHVSTYTLSTSYGEKKQVD